MHRVQSEFELIIESHGITFLPVWNRAPHLMKIASQKQGLRPLCGLFMLAFWRFLQDDAPTILVSHISIVSAMTPRYEV